MNEHNEYKDDDNTIITSNNNIDSSPEFQQKNKNFKIK